jgi:hypothetical protein
MATIPRLLFSNLPPELRNEIYKYLSAPESALPGLTVGLPLKLKLYECKHTALEFCPVHYGSAGLLALQKYDFQESHEYGSWLLNNGIELRVGIVFKGRVNTFVHVDWDKKIEAHLNKLAKLHPWLTKVVKYDIQILWAPIDGVLKSRKNKRVAGQIPRDMVKTLTCLLDKNLKRKRGAVNVRLRLEHRVAVETVFTGTKLGLAEFLSGKNALAGFNRQTWEVYKESCSLPLRDKTGSRLQLPLHEKKNEKIHLLVVEEESVDWSGMVKGQLVMRKYLEGEEVVESSAGNAETEVHSDRYLVLTLLAECLECR